MIASPYDELALTLAIPAYLPVSSVMDGVSGGVLFDALSLWFDGQIRNTLLLLGVSTYNTFDCAHRPVDLVLGVGRESSLKG